MYNSKDIREKLVKTGHVDVMISVGNNFFYQAESNKLMDTISQNMKEMGLI